MFLRAFHAGLVEQKQSDDILRKLLNTVISPGSGGGHRSSLGGCPHHRRGLSQRGCSPCHPHPALLSRASGGWGLSPQHGALWGISSASPRLVVVAEAGSQPTSC